MRVLAVTGMVAGIAYIFTPLTASGSADDPSGFDANLRYVAPVLMVGFLLLPLIPWIRHGNRPWILIGLFTILLIQGTVTQANWKFSHHLASIGLAFLIVGVPALIVAGLRARISTVAIVAFGLVMLVTAVALGRVRENYYLDHRYVTAAAPPLGGGFRRLAAVGAAPGLGTQGEPPRIGVVGRASAFGQYFFYGTDSATTSSTSASSSATAPTGRSSAAPPGAGRSTRATTTTSSPRPSSEPTRPWRLPRTLDLQRQERAGDHPVRARRVYKITGPLDPASCSPLGAAART